MSESVQNQATAPMNSQALLWIGRVLSGVTALGLLFSASMKLKGSPEVLSMFTGKFGYPASTCLPIGVTEALCALLYAIPRTAVLGAILITGYMGGAVATHVRIGEPFVPAIFIGVMAWAGLYLRDSRVRGVLPLR